MRTKVIATFLVLLPGMALACPPRPQQSPAPIERRAPQAHPQGNAYPMVSAAPPGQRHPFRGAHGEHLAGWMSEHSNLTLQQQEQALGQEPGFGDLPVETQQRYRNRLAQLAAMNPQRRQNLLARNEAMERLSPTQRAQVRGAMSQLGALPQDQRRAVAQTFRSLRDLPPDQRTAALSSGRIGNQLDGNQRNVLNNLLTVEPMLPPPNHPARSAFPQGPLPPEQGYPR